jgi:hypothetical protein
MFFCDLEDLLFFFLRALLYNICVFVLIRFRGSSEISGKGGKL